MKTKILFVDDELILRKIFVQKIESDELEIQTAVDGIDALKKLEKFSADIVITDIAMPNMDGLTLLNEIRINYPDIFVVVITGSGSIDIAVQAMKAGAYDYMIKPLVPELVRNSIANITGHIKLINETDFPGEDKRKGYRIENIVGKSPGMLEIYRRIIDVAQTNATVLINGETGTGKDLIASAIHYNSHRKTGPFIRVNCAALTDTLSNSELFGHEKGAFTGAVAAKKGYFEIADSGSIFLDEIADVPVATQVALLHSIENKTFQHVGGTKTIKVNTRIICATNKSIPDMIDKNLFREDLYYRINVVNIEVPPLRKRRSDIPILADYFLKKYCSEVKKNITGFSTAAMNILTDYDWPGNVRELSNAIEHAVVFCKEKKIVPPNLQNMMRAYPQKNAHHLTLSSWSLPRAEEIIIRKVLMETNGNLKLTADKLSIARGTLYSKMKKYCIERPE